MTDTNFIKKIDNFVDDSISELPDILNQPNTVKFLTIFLERMKSLDDVIVDFAEFRLLSTAQGVVLDEIGQQLNVYRNGQIDDDYRTTILIRLLAIGRGGTRPEVEDSLDELFPSEAAKWQMYKGNNYRIDLYCGSVCFDVDSVVDELVGLFPIMTHLRIIKTDFSRKTFGFAGDTSRAGFSASNNRTITTSGIMGKVSYVSDDFVV